MQETNEDTAFDELHKLTDIPEEEYIKAKQNYLSKGQSNNFRKYLIGRSVAPVLRNTVRPPGENYAPVFYTEDYMIKLVHKPGWGGYILALVVWDLVIIDIDIEEFSGVVEDHLGYIQKNIERYYPNDLFYVNKTSRGYHVYLVSRKVNHASKGAMYMRMKLNGDPAHGSNSLYTGSSVRLTSKLIGNNNNCISEYLTKFGSGTVDPEALQLYDTIQRYIRKYSCYGVDSITTDNELMTELYNMWDSISDNFGKLHIKTAAPMVLVKDELDVVSLKPRICVLPPALKRVANEVWSDFLKYRVIRTGNLDILLFQSKEQICMNNLYRILEATEDYAVGVHVQESCYFISYRDLFYVDIDHKSRLQIIFQYVRYHPEATFRIVKTNKGYHAFLTSYPVPYQECMPLSLRLCADHCHLLSVRHRGYSVRVNQKCLKETAYKEVYKVGKAEECPRLYALYLKHLTLYENNCKNRCTLYMAQNKGAMKILEETNK